VIVAFDTETHLIKDGMLAPKLVCSSWYYPDGWSVVKLREDTRAAFVGCVESRTLVGHNVAYDMGVLVAEWPELLPTVIEAYGRGAIRCTMLRQKLIDNLRGELKFRYNGNKPVKSEFSLKVLAKIWLGKELKKEGTYRTRYSELDGLYLNEWPAEAVEYAKLDAQVTYEVWEAQQSWLDDLHEGQLANEEELNKAAFSTQLMSIWGIRTDPKAVAELKESLTKQRTDAMAILRESGIIAIRGSKKRPKEVLNQAEIRKRVSEDFTRRGYEVPLTLKGKVSATRAVLKKCKDPGLQTLAASSNVMKVLSTYVPALERGTQVPICARYDVLKASGRTGCSKPNLQNPPRLGGVRECFTARPGMVFVMVDYDTLELRALAQVCLDLFGESALAEAFRRGDDPHLSLAASLLGIEREEAIERKRDKDVADMRQFAKVANFGFPGGLGVTKFVDHAASYGLVLETSFAKTLKENWFKQWPEMRRYFDYVNRLVGPLGGNMIQLRSCRARGGVNFKEAANGFFQGLAADGAKEALWRTTKECYLDRSSPLYGSRPVIFVHDEIIAEVPEATATEAADRLVDVMCRAMAAWIPDVPITCSPALMRRWLKGAKEVRDANGKLQVWEK